MRRSKHKSTAIRQRRQKAVRSPVLKQPAVLEQAPVLEQPPALPPPLSISQRLTAANVSLRSALSRNADGVILTFIVVMGILLPNILLAAHHISLTALYEESIGYRYFYSLRILYSSERPWLPQGQLPGLFHLAIQAILSTFGHPPSELFPRIDIFAFLGALTPIIIVGLAFLWAASPLRSAVERSAFAVLLLVFIYASRLPQGWMTTPDYYMWAFAIALTGGGWILRLLLSSAKPQKSLALALLLGMYAGFAAAVKPSLLVFPLAVGSILAVLNFRFKFLLVLASVSLSTAAAVWASLILCYYLGDVSALKTYFVDLQIFAKSQTDTLPHGAVGLAAFARELLPQNRYDFLFIGPVLILVMLSSIIVRKNRPLLALVPASLAAGYFCYLRYYALTLVETYAFLLMILLIVVAYLTRPPVRPLPAYVGWIIIAALALYFGPSETARMASFYRTVATLDSATKRFHNAVATNGGSVAYLTPDNTYRPPGVDSAIYKGGTDIFQYTWGVSPLIESMFPDRWYFVYGGIADVTPFANVVFIKLDEEPLQAAFKRVEDHFSTSLADFNCREIPAYGSSYVLCHQSGQIAPLRLSARQPRNVGTKRVTPRTVELHWSAMLGANEYQIEMANGRDPFQSIGKIPASQSFYRVGDVGSDAVYRFRVRGCALGGPCSLYSSEVVSEADNAIPGSVPQGLEAQRQSSALARLSWRPLTGLNGYQIEMARNSGAFEQIGSTTTAHYDVGGLPSAEIVRFRVRSCDSHGLCSPYSRIAVSHPLQR